MRGGFLASLNEKTSRPQHFAAGARGWTARSFKRGIEAAKPPPEECLVAEDSEWVRGEERTGVVFAEVEPPQAVIPA